MGSSAYGWVGDDREHHQKKFDWKEMRMRYICHNNKVFKIVKYKGKLPK